MTTFIFNIFVIFFLFLNSKYFLFKIFLNNFLCDRSHQHFESRNLFFGGLSKKKYIVHHRTRAQKTIQLPVSFDYFLRFKKISNENNYLNTNIKTKVDKMNALPIENCVI